ncbi:YueI family protein [Virgibacillus sp. 179-BFC.A HS]|uniref:YueI family protein n=1 Tax=Tigheibacillus jepli TaxID=3035914 RepID=A0ABU5CM69_9BACI|nr:YueI family protein [Virgibacillus sp. 179-BFC.A HS]MDY0406568.1 YueI family protein [Virgibacillus sp. 179-BFC.A HS]
MAIKNVDDYLQEGMYGTRLPKQAERNKFLGTLRERVVLALTIGQVMTDRGIKKLEAEIQAYPDAKLVFNGNIADKFLQSEKRVAHKYNIPYSVIIDQETETKIGAVLYYDHAIDKDDIYFHEEKETTKKPDKNEQSTGFLAKLKHWFG